MVAREQSDRLNYKIIYMVENKPLDWEQYLPSCQLSYNSYFANGREEHFYKIDFWIYQFASDRLQNEFGICKQSSLQM